MVVDLSIFQDKMSFKIHKIINNPIDSNCFIVYSKNKKCIVIDPGSENSEEIINFLESNNLNPEFIVLTHEHFDHVWAVNDLKVKYKSKVIASRLCGEKITNAKKNMSVFYNQIGFECFNCDVSIESIQNKMQWEDEEIIFIETPGHTNCSISIVIKNNIFVGDLMIPKHKTVTKLPTGNKEILKKSLENMFSDYKNFKIYPGHGDIFELREISINSFI